MTFVQGGGAPAPDEVPAQLSAAGQSLGPVTVRNMGQQGLFVHTTETNLNIGVPIMLQVQDPQQRTSWVVEGVIAYVSDVLNASSTGQRSGYTVRVTRGPTLVPPPHAPAAMGYGQEHTPTPYPPGPPGAQPPGAYGPDGNGAWAHQNSSSGFTMEQTPYPPPQAAGYGGPPPPPMHGPPPHGFSGPPQGPAGTPAYGYGNPMAGPYGQGQTPPPPPGPPNPYGAPPGVGGYGQDSNPGQPYAPPPPMAGAVPPAHQTTNPGFAGVQTPTPVPGMPPHAPGAVPYGYSQEAPPPMATPPVGPPGAPVAAPQHYPQGAAAMQSSGGFAAPGMAPSQPPPPMAHAGSYPPESIPVSQIGGQPPPVAPHRPAVPPPSAYAAAPPIPDPASGLPAPAAGYPGQQPAPVPGVPPYWVPPSR